MLREDVRQALVESDGQYTNVAMQNMKKLDSFLKEVLRFYPLSACMISLVRLNCELQLTWHSILPKKGSQTFHTVQRPGHPCWSRD